MITIDLLKHEQDQAEQIADKAMGNLVDSITMGPLLTEDQIKWIWMRIAQQAQSMNQVVDVKRSDTGIANRIHNMKIKT